MCKYFDRSDNNVDNVIGLSGVSQDNTGLTVHDRS